MKYGCLLLDLLLCYLYDLLMELLLYLMGLIPEESGFE